MTDDPFTSQKLEEEAEKKFEDYLSYCNRKIANNETEITINYHLPEQNTDYEDFNEVDHDDNNFRDNNLFLEFIIKNNNN